MFYSNSGSLDPAIWIPRHERIHLTVWSTKNKQTKQIPPKKGTKKQHKSILEINIWSDISEQESGFADTEIGRLGRNAGEVLD